MNIKQHALGVIFMACAMNVFAEDRDSTSFEITPNDDYELVWSEEFEKDGVVDSSYWNFEYGFVRNHEDQWYQQDNAYCKDGYLVIEARKCELPNPWYKEEARDWRSQRERIHYTSASINTRGKYNFLYGRIEVRAAIPIAGGAWPAIWTLGDGMPWPSCGEIDIMEYYRIESVPHILANVAWGDNRPHHAVWNTKRTPFSYFLDKDSKWAEKFHTWRMDWDEKQIALYLDDELLNLVPMDSIRNGTIGKGKNPFNSPQYILLNLALGGDNGGVIDNNAFPMQYLVDYVRVYQKKQK